MAPRSTKAAPAAKTSKAKATDADALVAETTELAALIAHHIPNAVAPLAHLNGLLRHLADAGESDEDGVVEDGDEDEEEAAPAPKGKGKVTTAAAKGKKKPEPVEDDEDEEDEPEADEDEEDEADEDDDSLAALPDFSKLSDVTDFLETVGIDIDEYDIPAKGPGRTKAATKIAEGLAAIIEAAETDKLVVKGKKTALDKLAETLKAAGGTVPKRSKKTDDKTYAWVLAVAIEAAETSDDEDEEDDE